MVPRFNNFYAGYSGWRVLFLASLIWSDPYLLSSNKSTRPWAVVKSGPLLARSSLALDGDLMKNFPSLCSDFGFPEMFMWEGPTHFINETLCLVCKSLGAFPCSTLPYFPRNDGSVKLLGKERLRRFCAIVNELQMNQHERPDLFLLYKVHWVMLHYHSKVPLQRSLLSPEMIPQLQSAHFFVRHLLPQCL